MKNSTFGKRTLAIVAASTMVLALAATVLADAPDPFIPLNSSVAALTVTVDGGWQWTTHSGDCNGDNRLVGFAVDWGDPAAAGNPVGATGFDVGVLAGDANNATDNAVHGALDCGVFDAGDGFNSGTWGPISHTYAAPGEYDVCVLMYDVQPDKNTDEPADSGNHGLTAGGDDRNTDNSAEKNDQTPLGNGCFKTTIVVETPGESVAESVAPSAEQSVEAGTGTPAQTQANTALSQSGSNPIPTIAFSLILLASLASLAYANVKTVRNRS